MQASETYPIGTPGCKWGAAERKQWLDRQYVQRSYEDDVLAKLNDLGEGFIVEQYGALPYDQARYPLFSVRSSTWSQDKPTALVTGGVHGYETSGVHGALRFLETHVLGFTEHFNIVVAPCVSPWGYETINRWNPDAIDPNRSFVEHGAAEESSALMCYIRSLAVAITVHIDLHETTDSDNSEFRPALASRDNVDHEIWDIPDGFYLVGDVENPAHDFQSHIVKQVKTVTHIAPADSDNKIIGEPIAQYGVINYANRALGLCAGFSGAEFCTTTEVYPDSPKVDSENCINAQLIAVCSGLEYVAGLNK